MPREAVGERRRRYFQRQKAAAVCASARREIETRDGPATRLRRHARTHELHGSNGATVSECVGKNDQRVRRRVRVRVMRIRVIAW